MSRTNWITALAGALVIPLLLTACATAAPSPTAAPKATAGPSPTQSKPAPASRSLIFGSQPIGTSAYIVATGLSTVMEKYTGMKVIVQPMATTTVLYNELVAGRVNFMATGQANQYVVTRGIEEYADAGPRPLRTLGTGMPSADLWVTRPDTGIKTIKDMVGKKLMYISAVSPTSTVIAELMLEYYGVKDKVTALPRGSMAAGARALIEKKVDAICGPYGSFGYEIEQAVGIVHVPVTKEVNDYLVQKRPDLVTVFHTFPAGYYAMKEPVGSIVRVREITVSPRMTDEVAYAATKAIYDHPEDTKAIHSDVGDFNLDNALAYGIYIPMHPGAIKYYTEKKLWTKELEAQQQKLLAEEKELAARAKK